MASAVSDCKNQCIHYWVCRNREQYEQIIAKDVKVELELPEYVAGVTEVSLICKNQIQPRFGNGYPKYIHIRDCHRCIHFGLCKNQEAYSKLCDSLKDNTTPFSLKCPLYEEKEKEIE